jgi:hypothetical protein
MSIVALKSGRIIRSDLEPADLSVALRGLRDGEHLVISDPGDERQTYIPPERVDYIQTDEYEVENG